MIHLNFVMFVENFKSNSSLFVLFCAGIRWHFHATFLNMKMLGMGFSSSIAMCLAWTEEAKIESWNIYRVTTEKRPGPLSRNTAFLPSQKNKHGVMNNLKYDSVNIFSALKSNEKKNQESSCRSIFVYWNSFCPTFGIINLLNVGLVTSVVDQTIPFITESLNISSYFHSA